MDEKYHDLDNEQVFIKQVVDAKAKVAWQALLLVQKSNTHCVCKSKSLKNEKSKDQKDSKVKKNHHLSNVNNNGRNEGQFVKVLGLSSLKNFYLNKKCQQDQFSNL